MTDDNRSNNMYSSDTVKLLRECDAGIKMGISSLENVSSNVYDPDLEQLLNRSMQEHIAFRADAEALLGKCGDPGKNPPAAAKAMSSMKTKLTLKNGSDEKAAAIIAKGCNSGVNSLNRYLDKYRAADNSCRALAGRVIAAEERLASELRQYMD